MNGILFGPWIGYLFTRTELPVSVCDLECNQFSINESTKFLLWTSSFSSSHTRVCFKWWPFETLHPIGQAGFNVSEEISASICSVEADIFYETSERTFSTRCENSNNHNLYKSFLHDYLCAFKQISASFTGFNKTT